MKNGTQQWICDVLFQTKFTLIVASHHNRRTRNCKYNQISGVPRPTPNKLQIRQNFEFDVYPDQPITNWGQIWCLRVNSWCPLPRQISAWLVGLYTVILWCRKRQIWPQILNFVGSCTHSSWPNTRQIWRAMVDLQCTLSCQILPWSVHRVTFEVRKSPNLTEFLTLAFLDGAT